MGEIYVWSEMDAGNWEAPRGKGKFDIETGWAQKIVERYPPTYLSSPPLKLTHHAWAWCDRTIEFELMTARKCFMSNVAMQILARFGLCCLVFIGASKNCSRTFRQSMAMCVCVQIGVHNFHSVGINRPIINLIQQICIAWWTLFFADKNGHWITIHGTKPCMQFRGQSSLVICAAVESFTVHLCRT